MVPVGVAVTLIGLIGDLLAHTLNPSSHAHEALIVLGRGNSPWHLLLLAGILLTAVGGIRWVASFRTQLAEVMAAWMALLLVAVIALGGWYGWTAGHEPVALTSASGHVHTTLASGPATTGGHSGHTSVSSQVPGTSDEGQAAFGHQHGTPGPTTPAEAEQRDQMLAQAKAATAKFQDISVAKAAGYRQVTQFIPGLGLHLVNLKLSDQVFDPAHPQVLLYEPDGTGGYTLVGVSYLSRHTTETPPAGFPGGGDVWHYHQNLCFLGDGKRHHRAQRFGLRLEARVLPGADGLDAPRLDLEDESERGVHGVQPSRLLGEGIPRGAVHGGRRSRPRTYRPL